MIWSLSRNASARRGCPLPVPPPKGGYRGNGCFLILSSAMVHGGKFCTLFLSKCSNGLQTLWDDPQAKPNTPRMPHFVGLLTFVL